MRRFQSETELIEALKRLAGPAPSRGRLKAGIGDDAAVLRPAPGTLQLLTTDQQIEGVHFRLDRASLDDVGRKAMAVNLSDIAAMGGRPGAFVLALGLPRRALDVMALFRGILEEATRHGAVLAGGDIARSPERLTVTIALEGSCPAREVVLRSGARPGDALYLIGNAGVSALGLTLLEAGFRLRGREVRVPARAAPLPERLRLAAERALRAHLCPEPLLRQARQLARARVPSAMIDTSDGLSRDLSNLCRASNVGAVVYLDALETTGGERELAALAGADWRDLALNGGEDYGLLFAVPPARETELGRFRPGHAALRRIGTVTRGKRLRLKGKGARSGVLADRGFDHLTRRS